MKIVLFVLTMVAGCRILTPEPAPVGDFAPMTKGTTWVYSSTSYVFQTSGISSRSRRDSLDITLTVFDSCVRNDSVIYELSMQEQGRRIKENPTTPPTSDTVYIDTTSLFSSIYTQGRFYDSLVYFGRQIPFFKAHTVDGSRITVKNGDRFYETTDTAILPGGTQREGVALYRENSGLARFDLFEFWSHYQMNLTLVLRSFNNVPID